MHFKKSYKRIFKTLVLILALMITSLSAVPVSAEQSYTLSSPSAPYAVGYNNSIGQSFIMPGTPHTLESIDLIICSYNTSSVIYIEIHSDSPAGPLLATSDSVSVLTPNFSIKQTFPFTGTNKITLNASETYYFVIVATTTPSFILNISNVVPGMFYFKTVTWNSTSTYDLTYQLNFARYNINYDANGGTNAPTDTESYPKDHSFTIMEPGSMTNGYLPFGGWNTSADGTGTDYTAGAAYTAGAEDLTLYAQWIADTEPPVIYAPSDQTFEATAYNTPLTWTQIGYATATDNMDTSLEIINDAPAGLLFPLGDTDINYATTDGFDNVAAATQRITITDTTPPDFAAPPPDITAVATGVNTYVDIGNVTVSDIFGLSQITNNGPADGMFPVGTTHINWIAIDTNGNYSTHDQTITVKYATPEVFQPVDLNGIYNQAKSGSSIPVKFSLGGDMGLGIFPAGYPCSITIPNPDSSVAPVDILEETITAGNTSLVYDSVNQQYVYIWKTSKAWANKSRELTLKFADGTIVTAKFYFIR